ncbi:WD repeat-containing protein 97 isoform X2 [Fundulus heteroclitus]|uniref:WD repeat-containing protein 97 isoform X2 n=1 Tax=Fundulus heteroclitus TaxID=8078 RepID=UPI00165AB3CD|nr:WD repeat-containing protein 97 isoform X2 [Fundulus heteroclitus]
MLTGKQPFLGLTPTKMPGWMIGWGPGPVFTLLDSELRHLGSADDALDIRLCEPAEHSWELVTAGHGNVCVWSVLLLRCKVRIQQGLQQHREYTHLALAPPLRDRPHRAYVAAGRFVTVVDLDGAMVLDHKWDLCESDITAMVFCVQLDCLIIASKDLSITAWGLDWVPRVTFIGHNGVVNSLHYCTKANLLISCAGDCTIRSWDVENCKAVDCVHTQQENPPLCLGGKRNGHPFFSFSAKGVDLWILTSWYTLHSRFKGDEGAPLTQILVLHSPPHYPTRVVCVSADSHVRLVSARTGDVLTSFKAEDKILCAAYCLHKELLLALTEEGTVLQASTLTNPAALIHTWKGRGQGPWLTTDTVSQRIAQNLPAPGPARCLALYSSMTDPLRALKEWKSLQEQGDHSQTNDRCVDHLKNKFWIIIGQTGGCVSVLTLDNGKVLQRYHAHNSQTVTALQVYPENNCLLSSGEDFTVVVWTVHPNPAVCLTRQRTVDCSPPELYLAAVDLQLALTFQEPHSGSYGLQLFDLQSTKKEDFRHKNAHSAPLTGVCVVPGPNVFVSSSLDKTVRIWNKRNKLIWMQQLLEAPECIAYGGNGQLFLGINGDLYKMEFAQFLPDKYKQTLLYNSFEDPLSALPIPKIKETHDQTDSSNYRTEKLLKAINSNQVTRIDVQHDEERLLIIDLDLKALIQETVNCTKRKPPSTKLTRKRAFDRYMYKLYGLPPSAEICEEEDLGEFSFKTKPHISRRRYVPKLKEDPLPPPKQDVPVKTKKAPVKVKEIPAPVQKVIRKKQVKEEKAKEPEEIVVPVEEPQPRLPTPPPKDPSPPPQREPSPEFPAFLKQFVETQWFPDLYPDKKSIPCSLSPEDFSMQLLSYVQNSSSTGDIKILEAVRALQILQSQIFLNTTDDLYTGVTDALEKFIRPEMAHLDRIVIVEMLHLLVYLKSAISYDLVKKLLTILAYKELELQVPVLRLLAALGVTQAEQWLYPEVEAWEVELEMEPNKWERLHDKAHCWMESWISKLKEYNRYLYMRSEVKWKPRSFSGVEVLKFFCLVQKEESRKVSFVPPAGQKYKVLLPQQNCSFKPILRLGEMYTMARRRKLRGVLLPPLHKRPYLMHFPSFITLPLSRVNLRPFHTNSYERLMRLPTRSYFIPEQSTAEYYRRRLEDEPVTVPPTPEEPSTTDDSEII